VTDYIEPTMSPSTLGQTATIADRYVLERELGHGDRGVLYTARDAALGRRVSVLVVSLATLASRPDRFLAEGQRLIAVDHPNIVRIYDVGIADGDAFVVAELVEGITLRDFLRRNGPVALATALEVVRQAAEGLTAGHANGINHGALSPENTVVSSDASGGLAVKVNNLGLSALFAEAPAPGRPGRPLAPAYAAPEQYFGSDIDERADVYSLGVIVFELLAGKPPFTGTVAELARKHRYAEPPPISEFGVWVPLSIEHAVARALAKNRNDRVGTVAAFARQLELAVTSRKLSAAEGRLETQHAAPAALNPIPPAPPRSVQFEASSRRNEARPAARTSRGRGRIDVPLELLVEALPRISRRTWLGLVLFPLLAFAGGMLVGLRTTERVAAEAPAEAPADTAPATMNGNGARPAATPRARTQPPARPPAPRDGGRPANVNGARRSPAS
jgi:serine/threonine-protein kinase